MMMAAHLLPGEALASVSTDARAVMGLARTDDQVHVRAATVREAIAFGPPGRTVQRQDASPHPDRDVTSMSHRGNAAPRQNLYGQGE
jgi:hypothetical protein